MNQILFGFALILFNFIAASGGETPLAVDLLPDFAGYLILWLMLEKRRFNSLTRGLYVGISFMIPISFLFFLAQIQNLFIGNLAADPRNTGWKLLNVVLSGVSYVYTEYYGALMLVAALMTGWLMIALLEYWERTNRHKLQCAVCRIGGGLSVVVALCHLASTFLILPIAWEWITYPLSLLLLGCAWFTMRDAEVIEKKSSN